MLSLRSTACIVLLFSVFAASGVSAQERTERFGDYVVHYSVFNSTFLQPEIAEAYDLVRSRDQVLVNISVNKIQASDTTPDGNTPLGFPADVSGYASNLMQQRQLLDFIEISEGDAFYYLAPLTHTDEETYNFTLSVDPETEAGPFDFTFSRTLYLGD